MRSKVIVGIMLIVLLIGMLTLAFKVQPVKSDPDTIYVDDDNIGGPWDGTSEHPYQNITSALQHASANDNICVYNGTYYENLVVNETVSLIGENKYNTIIDINQASGSVINVMVDNVTISGFTITREYSAVIGKIGIALNSNGNTVVNNMIENNTEGIWVNSELLWVNGSSSNKISCNIITNTHYGIAACFSSDNNISYNNITTRSEGIWLSGSSNNFVSCNNVHAYNGYGFGIIANVSDNNIVTGNIISNETFGISLRSVSRNNNITGNTVFDNQYGIEILVSSNNSLAENTVSNNTHGILLDYANNNTVFHNNLINNTNQAYDDDPSSNDWHHSILLEGNYWSDYTGVDDGSGVGKHAIAGDGIGDTLIPHPDTDYDFHPLMEPWTPSQPTPVGGIYIPVNKLSLLAPYLALVATIILAVSISVAYLKYRKKQ